MIDALNRRLLALLRVPHDPEPPAGGPGTLRVFRAGRAFYRLNLAGWMIKQVFALAAFVFWFWVLMQWESSARIAADNSQPPDPPQPVQQAEAQPETAGENADASKSTPEGARRKARKKNIRPEVLLAKYAHTTPSLIFTLLWVAKGVSLAVYCVQLPVTYLVLRLDYEQRWYLVTDRSLRLRSGVWSVRELTMSFANLQQITVSQGPLERLLGLADVCVQSAGGGGAVAGHQGAQMASLHQGVFHAVENAHEIRDLIVERLRRFRETGLGDPDEVKPAASAPAPVTASASANESLPAARELLEEIRQFRAAITQ
jgi:membrane protein YdbS with pleckstrin-like domain